MASLDGEVLSVVRNSRQRWFALAVVALMCFFILNGVIQENSSATLSEQLGYYFILAVPTWLVWRAVACSKVVVTDEGMLVVNWFQIFWVPWGAIMSIEAEEDVAITLTDGRKIKPAVGDASLGGALHGSPKQRAIREHIEGLRDQAQPRENAKVTSRIDLYAGRAVPVILAGSALVIGISLSNI